MNLLIRGLIRSCLGESTRADDSSGTELDAPRSGQTRGRNANLSGVIVECGRLQWMVMDEHCFLEAAQEPAFESEGRERAGDCDIREDGASEARG
jgi:hypothetical protein